jgi:hypothetical protein
VNRPEDLAVQVAALVERTCAEQGVPVHVVDRATVDQVVALLGRTDAGGRAQARSASTAPAPAGSEAPDRTHAVDGDVTGAPHAGQDLDVVDQGFDDGGLPGEVQAFPLVS